MSALRALIAAVSARLSASIEEPTSIALKLAVVSGSALKAARFAVGQTTGLGPGTAAFARAFVTLPPVEQSSTSRGRPGTGAPPRTYPTAAWTKWHWPGPSY